MDQPFIGAIFLFGGNFAPRNYAFCDGQILSIAQNTALFSILGTTYGGNGQTTFALPNLQGRVPVQQGQGPGLPNISLGQSSGSPTTTLITANMPAHTHALNGVSERGDVSSPAGAFPANSGGLDPEYRTSGTAVAMNSAAIGATGSNQSFSNMPPYLAVNYIIALNGIFPSRN